LFWIKVVHGNHTTALLRTVSIDHDPSQQQPQRIDQDKSLASFDQFATVKAVDLPLFSVVLTD
jgi:hypothetical protein